MPTFGNGLPPRLIPLARSGPNATQLPGSALLFGGIETHPITIIGTTLCKNPHYIPFDQYLASRHAFEVDPDSRFERLGRVTIGLLPSRSR